MTALEQSERGRAGGRHRRPAGQRARLVALALTVLVALAPPSVSVARAMTAPGQADTSVRLVEWLRDHGGGGLVNAAENAWYRRNRPTGGAPDPGSVPNTTAAPPSSAVGPSPLPQSADRVLPGEGRWQAAARRDHGRAPLFTAFFRPVPAASVVVGVAWLDQTLTRSVLVAGTQDPRRTVDGRTVDGHGGQVPPSLRDTLVATFNGGFKLKDSHGGYQSGNDVVVPLRGGAASLVVDDTGRIDVGAWGRDVGPGSHPVAVRQNLDLVVDRGAPVEGLADNAGQEWGAEGTQLQYTWRSGLGVDRRGNLLYVAADRVQLTDLAQALAAAGAVRGMQLDIHPQLVSFRSYGPNRAAPESGVPLLPAMRPPANRYLVPSQRDFLAVGSR